MAFISSASSSTRMELNAEYGLIQAAWGPWVGTRSGRCLDIKASIECDAEWLRFSQTILLHFMVMVSDTFQFLISIVELSTRRFKFWQYCTLTPKIFKDYLCQYRNLIEFPC
ncbi:hypothetical protein AVEN_101517-1 [Araneus ventricosus]|uniref:Uncharacterized protein n=1 Tax=Araneus ventricosus TaxID=182803 RepID=A0A4Y2VW46_ARAVE|nr:hypothetical protein AVEN_101517-1 [Araneus ventricosus]